MRFHPGRIFAACTKIFCKFSLSPALLFLLSTATAPSALSQQSPPAPAPAQNTQASLASAESAQLLELATELKAEVDKSTKDMLSITVIRKAEAVEHLAHGVKEKIREEAAAN